MDHSRPTAYFRFFEKGLNASREGKPAKVKTSSSKQITKRTITSIDPPSRYEQHLQRTRFQPGIHPEPTFMNE